MCTLVLISHCSLPELVDYYCDHPVTTDSQGRKLKLLRSEEAVAE